MAYKDLSEKEKQTEMLNLLNNIKENTSNGGAGAKTSSLSTDQSRALDERITALESRVAALEG